MSEWFITDDDCVQCCRPVPDAAPNTFEFFEIHSFDGHIDGKPFFVVSNAMINAKDYSEEEILSTLNSYDFEDLQDFVMGNFPENETASFINDSKAVAEKAYSSHVLAEMLFEMDSLLHYSESEHSSWNDAVRHIANKTGLDLAAFLKPEKNIALSEKITSAAARHASAVQDAQRPAGEVKKSKTTDTISR